MSSWKPREVCSVSQELSLHGGVGVDERNRANASTIEGWGDFVGEVSK